MTFGWWGQGVHAPARPSLCRKFKQSVVLQSSDAFCKRCILEVPRCANELHHKGICPSLRLVWDGTQGISNLRPVDILIGDGSVRTPLCRLIATCHAGNHLVNQLCHFVLHAMLSCRWFNYRIGIAAIARLKHRLARAMQSCSCSCFLLDSHARETFLNVQGSCRT